MDIPRHLPILPFFHFSLSLLLIISFHFSVHFIIFLLSFYPLEGNGIVRVPVIRDPV